MEKVKNEHENAIAAVHAEYVDRLHESDSRAGTYQRLSQGAAAERASLASYAAQLDRSLTEGRSLVRELRETVRLRDEQLIVLGKQLENDRSLLQK